MLSGRVLYYLILKITKGSAPIWNRIWIITSLRFPKTFSMILIVVKETFCSTIWYVEKFVKIQNSLFCENILTHKLLSLSSHFFNRTIWLVSWKIHENTEFIFFIFGENMWWGANISSVIIRSTNSTSENVQPHCVQATLVCYVMFYDKMLIWWTSALFALEGRPVLPGYALPTQWQYLINLITVLQILND